MKEVRGYETMLTGFNVGATCPEIIQPLSSRQPVLVQIRIRHFDAFTMPCVHAWIQLRNDPVYAPACTSARLWYTIQCHEVCSYCWCCCQSQGHTGFAPVAAMTVHLHSDWSTLYVRSTRVTVCNASNTWHNWKYLQMTGDLSEKWNNPPDVCTCVLSNNVQSYENPGISRLFVH